MSAGAVATPFDDLTPSQGQSSDVATPFDDLAKSTGPTPAQAAYRKAVAADPYAPAGQAEKAMGEEMGDNKAQAMDALKNTGMAALETAGGVLGASEFEPVTARVIQYLPQLAKIMKVGRDLGITTIGLKEAHDLYKAFSSDKK